MGGNLDKNTGEEILSLKKNQAKIVKKNISKINKKNLNKIIKNVSSASLSFKAQTSHIILTQR